MSHGSGAGRAVEQYCSPRSATVENASEFHGGAPCSSVEFPAFRVFTARPAWAALGILGCYAGLFYVALEAVR